VAARKRPAAKRPARWATPTVKAVRAELAELDERKPGIRDSALAAGAIAMAKKLDHPETTAAAAASCLRVLERALTGLHAKAPAKPQTEESELDRARAQRAARRTAS
jgi:hypothetical protein